MTGEGQQHATDAAFKPGYYSGSQRRGVSRLSS